MMILIAKLKVAIASTRLKNKNCNDCEVNGTPKVIAMTTVGATRRRRQSWHDDNYGVAAK